MKQGAFTKQDDATKWFIGLWYLLSTLVSGCYRWFWQNNTVGMEQPSFLVYKNKKQNTNVILKTKPFCLCALVS